MGLTPEERTRLTAAAADRAARQTTWLYGAAIGVAAAAIVVPLIAAGGQIDTLELILLLVPPAVFVLLFPLIHRFVRRRAQPLPLAVGADRHTRAEIQRAIRAGHSSDERIDAFVRELQDYHRRRHRQIWVPAALALGINLLLIGMVDHLVLRAIFAIGTLLIVAGLWHSLRTQRRLAGYRGHQRGGPG